MFWIWFASAILLLLSLPFLRLFYKRVRLLFKISKCCKKTRGKLIRAHCFWLFGRKAGKYFDFYIDTPQSVYAVKFFTILFKSSNLIFTDQGSFVIQHHFSVFGRFGVATTPIPSRAKMLPAYQPNKKLPQSALEKPVKLVLLVHPACFEMLKQTGVRKTELLYTGTVINGMEVHSLSGLLKEMQIYNAL